DLHLIRLGAKANHIRRQNNFCLCHINSYNRYQKGTSSSGAAAISSGGGSAGDGAAAPATAGAADLERKPSPPPPPSARPESIKENDSNVTFNLLIFWCVFLSSQVSNLRRPSSNKGLP